MLQYIITKWVIGKINDVLEENKNNVEKIKEVLSSWIIRVKNVLACLESLLKKVDDNALTEDELKSQITEIETLIKEW